MRANIPIVVTAFLYTVALTAAAPVPTGGIGINSDIQQYSSAPGTGAEASTALLLRPLARRSDNGEEVYEKADINTRAQQTFGQGISDRGVSSSNPGSSYPPIHAAYRAQRRSLEAASGGGKMPDDNGEDERNEPEAAETGMSLVRRAPVSGVPQGWKKQPTWVAEEWKKVRPPTVNPDQVKHRWLKYSSWHPKNWYGRMKTQDNQWKAEQSAERLKTKLWVGANPYDRHRPPTNLRNWDPLNPNGYMPPPASEGLVGIH